MSQRSNKGDHTDSTFAAIKGAGFQDVVAGFEHFATWAGTGFGREVLLAIFADVCMG